MTAPTLFDVETQGKVQHDAPMTSVDAARKITGKTERRILSMFTDGRGCEYTADELCRAMPTIYPPTLKSALSRLANHDLIVPTGETRLSDRGCAQNVYRLKT